MRTKYLISAWWWIERAGKKADVSDISYGLLVTVIAFYPPLENRIRKQEVRK